MMCLDLSYELDVGGFAQTAYRIETSLFGTVNYNINRFAHYQLICQVATDLTTFAV